MVKFRFFMLWVWALVVSSCGRVPEAEVFQTAEQSPSPGWKSELAEYLSLYGHRNWILVVDKAFPFQASPGITYLNSGASLPDALSHVLKSIGNSKHVKPIVYQDAEISLVDDGLAPGADDFKQQIRALLKHQPVHSLPHEAVFEKMDKAAELFGVLVIKTETTIPYSSVFIELDCAYWDAEREQRLRTKGL
ncbi:RbsD/FucU domain-containing protein [Parapedobacter sp.]